MEKKKSFDLRGTLLELLFKLITYAEWSSQFRKELRSPIKTAPRAPPGVYHHHQPPFGFGLSALVIKAPVGGGG